MPGSHHIASRQIGSIENAIYNAHAKLLATAGKAVFPKERESMTTRKKITTLVDILSRRPDGMMPLEVMLETMDIYKEKYNALIALIPEMENPVDKAFVMREAENALEVSVRLANMCAPFCHQKFASVTVNDVTPQVKEEQEFVICYSDPADVEESDEAREAREKRAKRLPHHMLGKSPSPYKQITAEAQTALRLLRDQGVVDITLEAIEEVLPPEKVDQRSNRKSNDS